jgi:predicted DNA-binding transcriptional regulator AlpA
VAKVLGVSQRTVYRWNATGNAPRVAHLALFWLTRWGQSLVHANAERDCMEAVGLARALGEQVERLNAEVASLRTLPGPGDGHD